MNEKFSVALKAFKYKRKMYGAGRCYVRLGGTDLGKAIALKAGRQQWVTTDDHAVDWLIDQGLPREKAEELIGEAVR